MKKTFIACLVLCSTFALAQDRPPPPDGKGPPPGMEGKGPPGGEGKGPPDIAKLLNIDANRAEKVQAVLRASHEQRMALRDSAASADKGQQGDRSVMREKMRALRDDTHKKLAAILTADELKKLEANMPPPPRPPQG